MAIWDRVSFIRHLFPARTAAEVHLARQAAGEAARRWYNARTKNPELAADLIRMAGLLQSQPGGAPAEQLAFEAGRRDMALSLLAMMNLSVSELNELMENNNVSSLED